MFRSNEFRLLSRVQQQQGAVHRNDCTAVMRLRKCARRSFSGTITCFTGGSCACMSLIAWDGSIRTNESMSTESIILASQTQRVRSVCVPLVVFRCRPLLVSRCRQVLLVCQMCAVNVEYCLLCRSWRGMVPTQHYATPSKATIGVPPVRPDKGTYRKEAGIIVLHRVRHYLERDTTCTLPVAGPQKNRRYIRIAEYV